MSYDEQIWNKDNQMRYINNDFGTIRYFVTAKFSRARGWRSAYLRFPKTEKYKTFENNKQHYQVNPMYCTQQGAENFDSHHHKVQLFWEGDKNLRNLVQAESDFTKKAYVIKCLIRHGHLHILDSYVVILFSAKWPAWGWKLVPQITPQGWIFWTIIFLI